MNNGYIYIIFRNSTSTYTKLAKQSAESLRKVQPNAKIAILTDTPIDDPIYDKVIYEPNLVPKELWRKPGDPEWGRVDGLFEGKMRLDLSPWDRTLYVDNDTYFYHDVSGLFKLLDWYDMALVPVAGDGFVRDPETGEEVEGFTTYNNGVVLYKKSPETLKVIKRMNEIYRSPQRSLQKRRTDQVYFTLAVAEAEKIKIHTLSRIYNARIERPISLHGPVKIAHAKGNVDFKAVEKIINAKTGTRVWDPKGQKIYGG